MNELLPTLLEHNHWATRVLLERCQAISPAQFSQRFEIGPGSLHDTFRHIIGAMIRWTDRIGARSVRPSIEGDPRTLTTDELLVMLESAAINLRQAVLLAAADPQLDVVMSMEPTHPSGAISFTRRAAILHVLTHGMHHRAQVSNMLRRLGHNDSPDTDVIEWELVRHTQQPSQA